MRQFEAKNVLQARLHKHFLTQIGIGGTSEASCFHENENKKLAWLNGVAYDKYMGRSLQRLLCSLRLMLIYAGCELKTVFA